MTNELYFSSLYYFMIAPAMYFLLWLLFVLIKPLGICRWFLQIATAWTFRDSTAKLKQELKAITKQQLYPLYRLISLALFLSFLLSLGLGLLLARSGSPKNIFVFLSDTLMLILLGSACLYPVWIKANKLGRSILLVTSEKKNPHYLMNHVIMVILYGFALLMLLLN